MKKRFLILLLLSLQSLIAQDAMRSCEKSDLIGKAWLISHSKVFDKNADLSQGSYLSYFISKLQMLKYL